jgi:23S rRNA pseudouridine2605 synthase
MSEKRQPDDSSRGIRLQKVLAAAGVGSRRECEELIRQGRIEVDRQVITELGTRVHPEQQEIRVDGESLRQTKRLYFAVNKPPGVVTTNHDPAGRPRVIDLVPTDERVFAVGRLDRSSEGLILVTNDGEFANRLTHPRYGVEKTYLVRVAGSPSQEQLAKLKKGVHLAEGFARAVSIVVKKHHGQSTDLVIVLDEGRNREIRRLLARVGHKVLALKRVAVGHIKLGDLPLGGWRRLMPDEVAALLQAAKKKKRSKSKVGAPARRVSLKSKVQSLKSKVEGGYERVEPEDQYVQKQALLAEPLSLDDLLGDDLDEGPITAAQTDFAPAAGEDDTVTPGGVIDYDDDFSAPPPTTRPPRPRRPEPRPPRGAQHRQGGKGGPRPRHRSRGAEQTDREGQPRESFGKKRGGKKAFGPREEGRGPAGEKAGHFRFKPKGKKSGKGKKFRPEGQGGRDNQRRGERRGSGAKQQGQQKQFNKRGGKRKGRR